MLLFGVFALGLLGAAYTLWYEDLTLHADVSTGTLNADLSFESAGPVVGIPPQGFDGVASWLDTDGSRHFTNGAQGYTNFTVANFTFQDVVKPKPTCTGDVTDGGGNQNGNTPGDENLLTLYMGNAYPYSGCEFEIDLHNAGTVPFHIAVSDIQFYICDGVGIDCQPSNGADAPWSVGIDPLEDQLVECVAWLGNTFGKIVTGPGNTVVHDFNGGPGYHSPLPLIQINTGLTSPVVGSAQISNTNATTPLQIHPGDDLTCKFKIILDQKNVEGQFFAFEVKYKAYQWNESPPFAP